MPHINRIRVNNIKYNFGTQYYDDFLMRFSCKNTIYDLANGGGKSVLMLLLLQNLIPNCTLDEKQPVEKLFRTSDGSKTIHSLIEWRLSDVHVKNNYKYMLTGFCARKAKDEQASVENDEAAEGMPVKENASIEYFNYVIFYREFNDNDIKNLPLNNGKEKITYNGLKAYLRELEKKDLSLSIKIFDRKGDYQRFIAEYGLYESEWEIIRGINKTEGHVRTYFETNYKTTRKVVEDLLIEEIIQKSFMNQTAESGEGEYMAKTLLDIKDKLLELSAKKEDIQSFDRQIEIIEGFASRVQSIKQLYFGKEDITDNIKKCHSFLKSLMKKDAQNKELLTNKEKELLADQKKIEGLIDAAKISSNEAEAEALGKEIKELMTKQENALIRLKKANEDLVLRESINDYSDYVYYKNQRDELKELIDASLKDKGEILSQITETTGQVFDRIESVKKDIDEEIKREEDILLKEEELIKELAGSIDKYYGELAVLDYLIEDGRAQEQTLNNKIIEKKNQSGLYIITDIQEDLDKRKGQYGDIVSRLNKNDEAIASLENKALSLKADIADMKNELASTEESLNNNIDERALLSQIENRENKLKEIYGQKDISVLTETIRIRNREAVLEEEAVNNQLAYKRGYLSQLKTGCPVGNGEELSKVKEYIDRYHGNVAIYGADYLKDKEAGQRQQILERFPILPYSIIIQKNFEAVTGDTGLKELELGDYAVPVISIETVENGQTSMEYMDMVFVMRDISLFVDEKAVDKETAKTEQIISDLQFRGEQLSEKVKVLQADYDFAREYENVYSPKINQALENYEKLRYLIKELQARLEEKREELGKVEKSLAQLYMAKSELEKNRDKADMSVTELQELKICMEEAEKNSEKLKELTLRRKKAEKEKNNSQARYEAEGRQSAERARRIDALKKQYQTYENSLNEYRKYYKEGTYAESPMETHELLARLKGLTGALNRDFTDLSDKQKLLDNYFVAMEKSLQAIDYKGMSVNEVKLKYESLAVTETTTDELIKLKEDIKEVKGLADSLRDEISGFKSRKDRLEGAIVNGKSAMEEKYGSYTPVIIENGDFDSYIKGKRAEAEAVQALLAQLRQELMEASKNTGKFAILEKDIEKVIEKAGIAVTDTAADMEAEYQGDYGMSEDDCDEYISGVLEKFDRYTKDIADKRSEFEHERQLLADTLRKLGAEPLAREVKESIDMPSNIKETDELIKSLKDTCNCLELEKERVGKSIDDMERIKDNFENQCIQTCINIKNELDRLPKQSKIFMDNETISIIHLSVPYVKEEQYKFRMSQYIDETTRTADELKSEAERIKYIRGRLSWKKLFSVIVTDMNGIKLNLYKRERIKEQSRYLKYEEAVGSTGQSQGIYIQFLIAIINYIAAINSKDKETTLKKVIFIDNPFGAAKDIYIWEPIFKLLKTNNVQLIVPARGVTPAITGRFDVNYVLGQKLIDGRQQTVVVDYSSLVDNEKMDYTKLEYEQTSLF